MKKLLLVSCICLAGVNSFAQRSRNNSGDRPVLYMGFSTGLNNGSGILGVNLDLAVLDQVSVSAGAGISTWGGKFFGEAKYYFSEANRGFAIGAGITHNTGVNNLTVNGMATTVGDQDVTFNCHPVTNAMFSVYKYWTVGKRNNRLHLQLGYSVRIAGGAHPYEVTNGYAVAGNYYASNTYVLTSNSRKTMDIVAPDGVIIGFGYSFALFNKH